MQTTEQNGSLTIVTRNKPIILGVVIAIALTIGTLLIIYETVIFFKLSTNFEWMILPLIILSLLLVIRKYAFNYRIIIGNNLFKIQKNVFGINYSNIQIAYETHFFNKETDSLYLYNPKQRISIIYVADLELDYLTVTDDTEKNIKTITINSNEEASIIFNKITNNFKSN